MAGPSLDPAPPAWTETQSRSFIYRGFGPAAVAAGLALAIATFVIFAGFTPIRPTTEVVLTLLVGDALDFWRVEAITRGSLLRLRAEMKLPGLANSLPTTSPPFAGSIRICWKRPPGPLADGGQV